jgi:hypothetical protein
MRSLPRGAGADAASCGTPEAAGLGDGWSPHAARPAQATIDEHRCTVRFMNVPPPSGRRRQTRLAAPIVEGSGLQIQTWPATRSLRLAPASENLSAGDAAIARNLQCLVPTTSVSYSGSGAPCPIRLGGTCRLQKLEDFERSLRTIPHGSAIAKTCNCRSPSLHSPCWHT